jgi:hypothetical protein
MLPIHMHALLVLRFVDELLVYATGWTLMSWCCIPQHLQALRESLRISIARTSRFCLNYDSYDGTD